MTRGMVIVEELPWHDGIRAFFGWRWKWELWAWDEVEKRYRPPAYVYHCESMEPFFSHGRARSHDKAMATGESFKRRLDRMQEDEMNRRYKITRRRV